VDIVGKRGWLFLISGILLVPGMVFLIIAPGLRAGIDFTGGSTITIEFVDEVDQDDLRDLLSELKVDDSTVQDFGDNMYFIRSKELSEGEKNTLVGQLTAGLSPGGSEVLAFDLVSPVVAQETVVAAFWAVLAAAVGIFLYVWWAFRNVPSPFRYGAAAIVALVHDAGVVIGIFAILGVVADVEVNTMFLIALLTVIGFSVNDTIVVFDRLRENIIAAPTRSLTANVNLSISETLGRSLNTSLTLLFTLLALMLFGGPTLRGFLLVLLIGVVVGTYSSIAVATQTLVVWEEGDIRKLYRRLRGRGSEAAS
jgi:preprotein translocase subunit SecF